MYYKIITLLKKEEYHFVVCRTILDADLKLLAAIYKSRKYVRDKIKEEVGFNDSFLLPLRVLQQPHFENNYNSQHTREQLGCGPIGLPKQRRR